MDQLTKEIAVVQAQVALHSCWREGIRPVSHTWGGRGEIVLPQFEACRAQLRMPVMQGRKSEAAQQIAFADKVVINKLDAVTPTEMEARNPALL